MVVSILITTVLISDAVIAGSDDNCLRKANRIKNRVMDTFEKKGITEVSNEGNLILCKDGTEHVNGVVERLLLKPWRRVQHWYLENNSVHTYFLPFKYREDKDWILGHFEAQFCYDENIVVVYDNIKNKVICKSNIK